MKRILFFAYGVFCHLLFLVTFAALAAFVGNLLLPQTIDGPPAGGTIAAAVVVDLLLLAAFAIQHSVMARPAFKRLWTRIVPTPIERSTYVLISCLVTGLLIWQWRPIPIVIWNVQNTIGWSIGMLLFSVGWLSVPLVSLMINHFDLFGTRQVWLYLQGKEYTPLPFRTPLAYSWVRHPLYLGWALAFWATPTMTVGHLLFAGVLTIYMAAAALVEERDLVDFYGEKYRRYQQQVGMFVPALISRREVPADESELAESTS
ncbi:MAG TPA: isoprenylcysteine carboxylmethyltransferase family protein [Pirellulaceae bacterium]|nr:isoprenylcysteine carboxylmethyltransferase family protein [Pirellulaceae bacterium]